jgi:hypothetical protein
MGMGRDWVEAFRPFVRGEWLGETRRMEGWYVMGVKIMVL